MKLEYIKKSKFYLNNKGQLREHISNYGKYAILLKQENLGSEINEKETKIPFTVVLKEDLKHFKRVNGNVIRKIQPDTLSKHNKMMLLQKVGNEIEKTLNNKE